MTIDPEGKLLTSCDTIFNTAFLQKSNLIDQFPFLESVFNDLLEDLELGRVVHFPQVATKHTFLSGYYDYNFKIIRIPNNQWGIQWEIMDVTETSEALKKQQQSDHEDSLAN